MVELEDQQVNLAKTHLLENANQGDLGVIEIRPSVQTKGKLFLFDKRNSS